MVNYFGTPPADGVHRYLCFNLAHGSELRGFDVYLRIVKKKKSGKFSLNSARVYALGWPLLGIFGIFENNFYGDLWDKLFIGKI